MTEVLCEAEFGEDGCIQLVQMPAADDAVTGTIDLRFRWSRRDDWDDGWGALDWPPAGYHSSPAWAFDALVLDDDGPLVFFGVAEPGATCRVQIGVTTYQLEGPTLIVVDQTDAAMTFHGPGGHQEVTPRR